MIMKMILLRNKCEKLSFQYFVIISSHSLKFKVNKKPKIEPSAMLSSESDDGAAKGKEDMAAMSRKKLLAREAERQNGTQTKAADQVIPKDEEISGGDLSDMEEDDVSASKKTEHAKQSNEDDASEKKGKSLKDKRQRSYRSKTGEGADSDEASNLKKDDGKNNRKSRSGTKELPLRYREDDDSSMKRGRHLDRPTSPSSPPPVFDRHQKRYGSSPRRHGRRHSQGSVSPQHYRYRQQDTLSKPYRGSGHSYNSWRRSKSPRQQRGHWGSSSPNRGHSPGDKRHQADDDQGSWKNSRYSSQRTRLDNKRKSAGDQDGYEGKKRRTETGGPRSPSATPPPPPDTEEPRPQQPSEPPPTQPAPPLPSEGNFMPSSKEPTRETVTGNVVRFIALYYFTYFRSCCTNHRCWTTSIHQPATPAADSSTTRG